MDICKIARADPKTELQDNRSERAKVFQLPNGKKRHLCFGCPIHYKTKVGEGERPDREDWDDIDIRLQSYPAETGKSFGNHLALKNKFTYGFRDDGKKDKFIGIRRGADNQMEWTLKSVQIDGKNLFLLETFDSVKTPTLFSCEHKSSAFSVITDFNEVHLRTAIRVNTADDFLIQEYLDLKGIKVLNKLGKDGYIPIDGQFLFETLDGEKLWIPQPKMWRDETDEGDDFSRGIAHRLYLDDGRLVYEKTPTDEGKKWLKEVKTPVYIDGDTYTGSTGDGSVGKFGDNWANIRSATSGSDYDNSATKSQDSIGAGGNGSFYAIKRSFFFFNTSGISETVDSCSLKIYEYSLHGSDISAQKSTISGTTVNNNDQYNDFSGSEYGHTTWVDNWNTISFNAQGCLDVDTAGTTKICCREYTHDYSNSSPSQFYNNGCYFADDVTYKPYLDIVEAAASTPVSTDIKLKYAIRALASDDFKLKYHVRNLIADDLKLDYAVRAKTGTAAVKAKYAIRNSISDDLKLLYHLKNVANDILKADYHIRNLITDDLKLDYAIRMLTGAAGIKLRHDIRNLAGDEARLKYMVRNLVSDDVKLIYCIRNAISDTMQADYSIRSLITDILKAVYAIGDPSAIAGRPRDEQDLIGGSAFSSEITIVGASTSAEDEIDGQAVS